MDHGVARGTVPHGPRLARNAAANATGDCLADLFGAALETALDGATAPGVPVAAPENPVAIDAQVEVARQRVAAIEAQPPAPEPTVPEAAPRPVIASSTPAGE